MKRSEINQIMRNAEKFLASRQFVLPEWAAWSVDDWKAHQGQVDYITERMLGWDITDFGSGDFLHRGLFLFTLRNGKYGVDKKPYAEKIMIVQEEQETPMHFHWSKMEDIINRAGGTVLIRVYNSLADESIDRESDVTVHVDGHERVVPAGTQVRLGPGQSITITPLLYHDFTVEAGGGPVLLGEVSQVNDDSSDNRFEPPMGRFPTIEEDEPPYRLLCNEYPAAP